MKNRLNILLGTLFLLVFNTFVFADNWEGDGTRVTVTVPPEEVGARAKTPIDMYEGALMMIAIVLIVGYYVYHRNKKIKHI